MDRNEQYHRKEAYILEMISLFHKPTERDQRDALFYRVQTAIEAAMDLVAMLVTDNRKTIGDDYHNIYTLEEEKILSVSLATQLRKLNGLRNALAHRYNKFEEKIVIDNIDSIKQSLKALVLITTHEQKITPKHKARS